MTPRIQRFGLLPALLLGAGSVVYWHWSDDLRLYIWAQLAPMLAAPAVILLFPARHSLRSWLLFGLACYGAAKLAELADGSIFQVSAGLLGGHTVKHLLAALAAAAIHLMLLRRRAPLPGYRAKRIRTKRSGCRPSTLVHEVSYKMTSHCW